MVTTPAQPLISKSGYPDSIMVGTSGSCGTRRALVTASARTFPARMCGSEGGTESTMMSTSPARSAVIAAAAPR